MDFTTPKNRTGVIEAEGNYFIATVNMDGFAKQFKFTENPAVELIDATVDKWELAEEQRVLDEKKNQYELGLDALTLALYRENIESSLGQAI